MLFRRLRSSTSSSSLQHHHRHQHHLPLSATCSSPLRAFHSRSGGVNPNTNDGGKMWTARDIFFESPDALSPELAGDNSLSILRRPGQNQRQQQQGSSIQQQHRAAGADNVSSGEDGGDGAGGPGAANSSNLSNAAQQALQWTNEEVLLRTENALRWYDPVAYAWLAMPSVDLVDVMVMKGVVPRDQPQLHIARWFAMPEDVVYQPSALRDILGNERYNIVAPEIKKLLSDYEEGVSPLIRALRKHPELPRGIWVALTRWMAVMASRAEAKDTVLALTLAISNGLGPQSLALPELQQQRGAIVGDILIGAGAEYGAVSLAQLGVDLLLINGRTCTFQDQKTLTHAFSRTSGRLMDWSVRVSGELVRCLPRWFANHVFSGTLKEEEAATAPAPTAALVEDKLPIDAGGGPDEGTEQVEVVGGEQELTDDQHQELFEKIEDVHDHVGGVEAKGTSKLKTHQQQHIQTAPGTVAELEEIEDGPGAVAGGAGGAAVDDAVDSMVSLATDTDKAREKRLIEQLGKDSIFFGATDDAASLSTAADGAGKKKEQSKKQQQEKTHKSSSSSSSSPEGKSSSPLVSSDPTWRYFKADTKHKKVYSSVREALVQQSQARQQRVGEIVEQSKRKKAEQQQQPKSEHKRRGRAKKSLL